MGNQLPGGSRPPLILILLLLLVPWILWAAVGDRAWATPGQSPVNQTVPPRKPTPPISPTKPPGRTGDEGGGGTAAAPIVDPMPAPTSMLRPGGGADAVQGEESVSLPMADGPAVQPDAASASDQGTSETDGASAREGEPALFETPLRPSDRQEDSEAAPGMREREDQPGRGITPMQLGMCLIPAAGVFLLLLGVILRTRAGGR